MPKALVSVQSNCMFNFEILSTSELSEKYIQKRKLKANLLKTKITTTQGKKKSYDEPLKISSNNIAQGNKQLPVVVFNSPKALMKSPHIHATLKLLKTRILLSLSETCFV